ncbi:hypothetical protein COOONC_02884 [Cooperia oncophora]
MLEPIADLARQIADLSPGPEEHEVAENRGAREEDVVVDIEGSQNPESADEWHEGNIRDDSPRTICPFLRFFFDITCYAIAFTSWKTFCRKVRYSVKRLMHEAYRRYGHSKSFHCNPCDSRSEGSVWLHCSVTPKRCKASKRTTIHFLQIEPQLSLILGRILSRLIQNDRQIHAGDDSGKRSETYSFPWYKRFIETHTDFDECKINIILTINFNGVKGRTLTVANLAYLPSHRRSAVQGEKQGRKHSIGWQTFSKKTPTETLLREMFSRLRSELEALLDSGIPIVVDDRTWFSTPVLSKGALKTLYDLPRWQSQNGCHLCTFEGERRMMEILMFNNCIPDALHVISEGITCDVFRGSRLTLLFRFPWGFKAISLAMFSPKSHVPAMKVRSECLQEFYSFITATRNFTYAAKFVLGMDDLSGITGSEKDAVMAVLAYWTLVRVLEKSAELTVHDFPGVQELASAMKNLWYAIEPTLCTMKGVSLCSS